MINNPTNIMRISLPEDWSVHSFDEISEFDKKTVDPLKKPDQLFNYITISDIQNYRINSYQEFIGKEAPSRARKKVVNEDIIVSTVRPYLKAFAKIDEKYENFICSTGFSVISPKENVLSDYLYYLIQTDQFTNELMRRMVGATYPAVTSSDIKHLKVLVPPLVEQRGIVEVLGTVDECIRLTDAVIERAEELKRGLMQQLLTRGIGHTEYKETPLGEIPKTWKIVNLEDVAAEEKNAFVDGPFGSNLKVSDYTDIGVRIIRLNNIGEGKFVDSYKRYISETKFNDLLKHAIYPGDIIISEMADPIARACIVPNVEEKYMLTAKSVRLNVNNKYNTNFMMYLINSPTVRNQAKSQTMGSTRPMITLSGLKKLKIPLPPILEQNKISNILCTLDNYFEIKNSEKKKYLDIKKGLMQILLSGKIRIGLKGDELHRIGDGREANN